MSEEQRGEGRTTAEASDARLEAVHLGALPVFISYRHEDAPAQAGRLADRLVARFGKDHVFMDLDAIDPGLDFREVLRNAINACDVLIVVIGRNWLSVTEKDGRRRLDDPNDYVRLEIEAALEREVRVIPVLVDGASMPAPEELPEGLTSLCFRNAVEIGKHFHSDVSELITKLEKLEWARTAGGQRAMQVQAADALSAPTDERTLGVESSTAPAATDVAPPRTQVPRRLRLDRKALSLALAIVLLVGGGVAAAIVLTNSDGGSATKSGDAGMRPLHAGMQHLEELVPFVEKWGCRSVRTSSSAIDEQAICAPKQGADDVQLALFKSKRAMRTTYKGKVKHARTVSPTNLKPNGGRCTAGYWGGEVEWEHAQGIHGGRKLCYLTRSRASYLIWTYEDASLLVTAHRSDEAHGQLNKWFNLVAHDIAAGGKKHMG